MDHPNVLPLVGFTRGDGIPALVSEWMSNGTVTAYLKLFPNANKFKLVRLYLLSSGETDIMLNQVKGIADGLAYLHLQDIIHSDLKSVSHCHSRVVLS